MKELKQGSGLSPYREWYNSWVKENAKGKVLDVGKSRYWDYGFETIDLNEELDPTHTANIEDVDFPDGYFDMVLCNGMYECVENPQKMIDNCIRITKKGGLTIFGFVGKDYFPYKKDWKFYDGKENIPGVVEQKDFGKEYYFLICRK